MNPGAMWQLPRISELRMENPEDSTFPAAMNAHRDKLGARPCGTTRKKMKQNFDNTWQLTKCY